MSESNTRENEVQIKALILLSGGLDSQLAACVLKEQGIEVHGIVFSSPFFGPAKAQKAAAALGIPLIVQEFTDDILALVKKPPHGFGANMNPCIDCHGAMLRIAGRIMEERHFHFLSTGEVLNERPMSQNRRSLAVVASLSGHDGFVLRPLSAKLLAETEPEKRGWVKRDRLLALSGRGREVQLRLATHYGLREFASPAGGCMLTDPNFCRRLQDLKEHEGLDNIGLIARLRIGRHFRLGPRTRLVVGRNEGENTELEKGALPGELILSPDVVPGPTCLLPTACSEQEMLLSGSICARYCDAKPGETVLIRLRSKEGERVLEATALPHEQVEGYRI